jgi:hypothetical protein
MVNPVSVGIAALREVSIGTGGHPQIFLIRGGRGHFVGSTDWCDRNSYSSDDVMLADDDVIKQVAEGEILI